MTPPSVEVPRRRYPHLLKQDAALWGQYLKLHKDEYSHFDYDVRVGLGRDPGSEQPENWRKMGLDLSMRRIDVVGYTNIDIRIIEVTQSAGITALGQVMAYPILYRSTYFPDLPLSVLLVAREIQSDMEPVFQALGISFIVIEAEGEAE